MDAKASPGMAPPDAPANEKDLYPHAGCPEFLLPHVPSVIKGKQEVERLRRSEGKRLANNYSI